MRGISKTVKAHRGNVRHEMVEFIQYELLIEKWMRGQSMLDVAAANSDGPDHGPMGAHTMHGPQSP